jgi:hypothetical protein
LQQTEFNRILKRSDTSAYQNDQVGYIPEMQEWSNIWKSLNVIHTILTEAKKKATLSYQQMQKKINKIQFFFMTKSLMKL